MVKERLESDRSSGWLGEEKLMIGIVDPAAATAAAAALVVVRGRRERKVNGGKRGNHLSFLTSTTPAGAGAGAGAAPLVALVLHLKAGDLGEPEKPERDNVDK